MGKDELWRTDDAGQSVNENAVQSPEADSSADTKQEDAQGMEESGQSHKMSIALTIGATMGLIGLVLLLYGLFGGASYSQSNGININLWWGLLLVIFGIIMSGGGLISTRRKRQAAQ